MRLSIFMSGFMLISLFLTPLTFAHSTDSSSLREDMQTGIKTRRDDVIKRHKERKAELEQRRQEFRQNLQTIRDTRKRKVTERLDDKLQSTNTRVTTYLTEVLEKLGNILARIDAKSQALGANGTDISTAKTAIEAANQAIANAKSAVSSQSDKTYIITITDENNLRTDVGKTVSQLHQDLRDTRKIVVDAKQAVMEAARELAKIKKQSLN